MILVKPQKSIQQGNLIVKNPTYGTTNKRKVICVALGERLFTYNENGYEDQIQTTLKKIETHQHDLWTGHQK